MLNKLLKMFSDRKTHKRPKTRKTNHLSLSFNPVKGYRSIHDKKRY